MKSKRLLALGCLITSCAVLSSMSVANGAKVKEEEYDDDYYYDDNDKDRDSGLDFFNTIKSI